MESIIIFALLIAAVIIWAVSVQRRLVVMDENINHAMNQIGVHLSSRFDILVRLLILSRDYDDHEAKALIESAKSRRSVITAASSPDDVLKQEALISETLRCLNAMVEQHPELKANETFVKCMGAVDSYEKMARTSLLIYNDSVTRFNRELRLFPTSLVGNMLGFRQRAYLEIVNQNACIPMYKQ